MTVRQLPLDDFIDKGALRASAQFTADPLALDWIERGQDDLDAYEAAYFMVSGVPVVIQRYVGNEDNQYTVSIDASTAYRPQRVHELLDELFRSKNIPANVVSWLQEDEPKYISRF